MYCSSCGTALAPGLSYCNRCGGKLEAKNQSIDKASEPRPDHLVAAMVFITTVGLFSIVALVALLRWTPQLFGPIMAFAMLSFLLVLAIDSLFLWLLLRSKKLSKADDAPIQLKERTTRELEAGQMNALSEPALSVTDHTTRTLAPVPTSRGAG
jgi:hypothetical protein